jgi:CTP synthase (UTP-ammonia lyase)
MTEATGGPAAADTVVPTARLALVGDRSESVRSHRRIPRLLDMLRERDGLLIDAYWIPTEEAERAAVEGESAVDGFDAVWTVPGSPYRSETGALAAIRTARERGIPFLGTCAGFQHAVLEYARNVCGDTGARHAENEPGAGEGALIVPLACSLVGHEGALRLTPGSRAQRLLGAADTVERYHCAFGLDRDRLDGLAAHGLRFTGHDPDGEPRVAELPGHSFYLVTLFQPELAGDGSVPHPFVRGLAEAAVAHAANRRASLTGW